MDQILDITLILDNCKLTAIDHTIVPDNAESVYANYVNVEFIVHNDETTPEKVILSDTSQKSTTFDLKNDGIYHYYKLSIPSIEYFFDVEYPESIIGELFFVYDEFRTKLMQIQDTPSVLTVDGIVSVSKEVTYMDAYNAVFKEVDQELEANESYFFPKKEVFNICKIRKCLVYLQRKMLLGNCPETGDCSETKDLRNTRDFLMSAVYVLEYLKNTGNFAEAQRIIDNLSTCGFPCEDKDFTFSDCGCGHTV